ncbi:MAG: DUF2059 domain-containing protein [Rhodomicrobium sp.]|nr:DUF2059 domain-containing protein [Rhodomicrobium sp.]
MHGAFFQAVMESVVTFTANIDFSRLDRLAALGDFLGSRCFLRPGKEKIDEQPHMSVQGHSMNGSSKMDILSYGRRAAEAMDVARVLDRTLEMLLAAATDANAKDTLAKLRLQVQSEKQGLIDKVGEIYAAVYSPDELTALVDFLESPAGRAMRSKQQDVEAKVQQATTEFLQGLIIGNR